jgi:phosphatidyl-myo-inositol dimannoside synthase
MRSTAGRVLMLTSTLPRWRSDATARFVLDLAIALTGIGWKIDILAPGFSGAQRLEVWDGVQVHRFTYALPANMQTLCYGGGILPNIRSNPAKVALILPFLLNALASTRRLVRQLNPDIVHAHWIVPMGLVGALATPAKVPLVVTVHGSDALDLKAGIFRCANGLVLSRATAITCNGPRTARAIAPFAGEGQQVVRIPMGARAAVGPDHDEAIDPGRFTILFAGRLFRGKGLDDLLDALALFDVRDRPYLLVAGVGPESERYKRRMAELGLHPDVKFLGGVEHGRLLTLMRDVSAVVAPTRSNEWVEAQGLVVAEAMLSGAAVIGTTGGGAEDHVQHEVTGLLVPPSNPEAIAGALRRLMVRPDLARAMGEAARRYASDRLSWGACARGFDRVYHGVIA